MPKTVAVLLARMGSTRLAAKSLATVAGKPMIVQIIERMRRAEGIDQVVLATPDKPQDKPLQAAGRDAGAAVFGGSEEDVLDRLYQAARSAQAERVVHIGGDCAFVDPALMERALGLLSESSADYVSNLMPMTFPSGMDVDAFTFAALERAWKSATLRTTRKHPLAYFYQNPEEFRIVNFAHEPNLAHLRWTLDYPDDLAFVRAVYDRLLPANPRFGMTEILQLLEREPDLRNINAHLGKYQEGQPAYWDSVGYMTDVRADLQSAVSEAVAAESRGDITVAARQYRAAQGLLRDLTARAEFLQREGKACSTR